ncbi:transcriptional repressor NrdR [bacterium]|nr:transcriptional repressor NrdR [bacterium]
MRCTRCHTPTRVIDSREAPDGRAVRRRRECESCDLRFTTFERIEDNFPLVVKKDGGRQEFDRAKIFLGIKKACEKRPVSVEKMEQAARDIEAKIIEPGEKEIASTAIGELVMDKLRLLDPVAYVRFASVYREFSDVKEFMDTLKSLKQKE